MEPKWESRRATAQNGPKMASRTHSLRRSRRFLTIFGPSLDPPKSTQNATLAENGVTRTGCLSIFVLFPFLSAFVSRSASVAYSTMRNSGH